MPPADGAREVFFETVRTGGVLRCAAIDSETGLEVVVFGPPESAGPAIEQLALAKLTRALSKSSDAKKANAAPRAKPGRGILT